MIMRNLARSHFEAAVGAAAAVAGAAEVASVAGAAAALPSDVNTANSTAVTALPRSAASKQELSPLAKAYSAAAIRGGPTKPAGSPKRSIMTAVRSLVLLVTQAPERTV